MSALLMHADLVISRGPTVLKEAALLQTPSVWLSDAKAQNRLAHPSNQGIFVRHPTSIQSSRVGQTEGGLPLSQWYPIWPRELVTQLESAVEIPAIEPYPLDLKIKMAKR